MDKLSCQDIERQSAYSFWISWITSTHRQESIFGCSEAQEPVSLIAVYGIVHSHLSSAHVYSKTYTFPVSLLPVMLYHRFRNGVGFLKSSS